MSAPWAWSRVPPLLAMLLRCRRGREDSVDCFQIGTIPGNRNMRAALGKVVEHEPRTAALKQTLRDEDPKTHMVRYTRTCRKIGLAETPQEVERKPRPVIVEFDRDRRCIPEDSDADLSGGKLDCVLNKIVEPMHYLRAAPDERLLSCRLAGRCEYQPHPLIAIRCRRRLDQSRDR